MNIIKFNYLLNNLDNYFDGFKFLYIFMTLYGLLYIFLYILFINNPKFSNLNFNRKLYTIKNIAKSIGLSLILIYGFTTLFDTIFYNEWNNYNLHRIGFIYASSDVLSLLIVRKLPTSTKIHHIIVLIFALINSIIDYKIDTYWRGLIIYTVFSCFSYLVNTYLGIRHIYDNESIKVTCKIALYVYTYSCLFNWLYQLFIICKWIMLLSPGIILYTGMIGMVVYDDIILIKFLHKNVYN